MTPEQLKAAIDHLKGALDKGNNEQCEFTAVDTDKLQTLLDAFMGQQLDLEGLCLLYVGLLKSSKELQFWSKVLTGTIRPASKNRAFVSKESAEKLLAAVKAYETQDGQAREQEKPIAVQATPILSETKQVTTKSTCNIRSSRA